GSRHTAQRLWDTLDDPTLPARTRLGPPGVDVARFAPRTPASAREQLAALAARLEERATAAEATGVDETAAADASSFALEHRTAAEAIGTLASTPGDRLV